MANNELAGRKRRSPAGHLVVTPPNPDHVRAPHIISPLAPQSDLWILPDESVTLECLASAYPPTSAKWSVNGTTVPAGPQNGYFVTSSPGDYACSVASASGSSAVDSTARVFSVRVAAAPSIIRRPKSQVLPTAKTVRFECEVSGSPTPEIQWLKVRLDTGFQTGRRRRRRREGGREEREEKRRECCFFCCHQIIYISKVGPKCLTRPTWSGTNKPRL